MKFFTFLSLFLAPTVSVAAMPYVGLYQTIDDETNAP